jgi:predicted AlkP superfamily pyrophosphatase or phosphodiesterase
LRSVFAAALFAFALGLGRADAKPVVILLSFDGVRHDYLDRGGLPAFERIAREGARAEALIPIFPSTTFPNHVALATGTHADRHGVVGNSFDDEKLGSFHYRNNGGDAARFLDAEPLWAAAERQGVAAATFFWVGSETDWRGVGPRHRKAPFDSKVSEAEKVAQILAWLDLPEPERPGLVMAWWHGADHAGHRHGPDAKQTTAALRSQDRELARLLAGLDARKAWPDTTLLIVSDHGMTAYAKAVDVRAVLAEAGVRARVIHAVASAQIHLKQPAQAGRAVEVLRALPGVEAWARPELPERLRYRHPRAGDVVALAEPPLALLPANDRGARFGGLRRLLGGALGAHGYDPARHESMHAIFVALGRGVPAGARLPRVRAIDVAPTVARLLGIAPPASSEGTPIPALGEGEAIAGISPASAPRRPAPPSAR